MTLGYILPSETTLLQRFWNRKEHWSVWNTKEHGTKRADTVAKDTLLPIKEINSVATNDPRIDATDHGLLSVEEILIKDLNDKTFQEKIIMKDVTLKTCEQKGTSKTDGPLGTSKTDGPLGTSKTDGPLGTSKTDGPLGTSKTDGPLGTSKTDGPLGTSKTDGPLGTSKTDGPLGTSKTDGPLGTSKTDGPLGTSKTDGPLGTSKTDGPLGTSKTDGPLGTSKTDGPLEDDRDFGLVTESVDMDNLNPFFLRNDKDDKALEGREKNAVESSESKRPDEEYEPPDGGWGWYIVCANAICAMMFTTQGPCFGVFFGPRLRELGATATLTAWIFNFLSLTRNLAGPWAGLLGSKFGYRPVAMLGAFTAALSFIVSSLNFCNPMYFLLTFSFLSGVGGGLCINSCYHMSAAYFKKRLGLANGIMVTGGSVGFIVMPILGAKLQEHFSFQWTSIIAGCVLMLAVPGTAFFQPLEWYMKRKSTGQDQESADRQETDIVEQEKEGGGGLLKKFLSQFKPSVLRDPLVLTTALYTGLSITTLLNIVSTVPFLLNDAGYNLKDSSWPVSVAAFADLGTRVLCSSVVDFPWLNVRLLYAVAQIIAILAPNALVLGVHNYTMVLLTMGSVGIGLGIMYVLDVYIIIRVLGVERMQSVYGISQLLRVLSYSLIGPMGGVLRQATGSYRASIILYTCTISVGLSLLVSTYIYTQFWPMKKDKKSNKEKN